MKILIATHNFPNTPDESNDAGTFIKHFADELTVQGHSVHVLCPDYNQPTKSFHPINITRFKWPGGDKKLGELSLWSPFNLVSIFAFIMNARRALRRLCKSTHFDCIIACWIFPAGAFIYKDAISYHIPYAVWALGRDVWMFESKKFTHKLFRKITGNAMKVYADGYILADDVKRLGKIHECRFLPSLRVLPKSGLPKVTLERKKKHFLFIGRWHKNKGPDILIEAIHQISKKRLVKMHFHIWGGGPMEEHLRAMIDYYHISDYVTLYSYADSKIAAAWLNACDALIIPSRIESIPVIFSDALQSGLPIIATPVGDMKRLLTEYTVGVLAHETTAPALKKAIETFNTMSTITFRRGIRKANALFNMTTTVQRFITDITTGISYE